MKKLIVTILLASILGIIIWLFLDRVVISFHDNIRKKPRRFVYDTFMGPPNPVIFVKGDADKDSLVAYYKRLEKGIETPFHVPLQTLPMNDQVYILGYSSDSSLAEFVSYYDRGMKFGGSYTRGFVYAKTLHINPPILKKNPYPGRKYTVYPADLNEDSIWPDTIFH